jgi:uncharacterized protein (TIGR00369 family)
MSRAASFDPLPAELVERWSNLGNWERQYFVGLVGLQVEEVRRDYCRMRLPFRPDIEQTAGVVHGGAIATLLDSVVAPAIGQAYDNGERFSTVDMHVQFLAALVEEDAVAEGWVVRRGRSVVFCEAEAVGGQSGKRIARSLLTYNVSA